jgi:hypothetical protein
MSLGQYGSAEAEGVGGLAVAAGHRARGRIGPEAVLVLLERDENGKLLNKLIACVGEHGIEAGKWYELQDGKPVEVTL